ncbi:hypothetical protein ACWF94_14805, partial [Streptomyces sp. NPDC055078]
MAGSLCHRPSGRSPGGASLEHVPALLELSPWRLTVKAPHGDYAAVNVLFDQRHSDSVADFPPSPRSSWPT